MSVIVKGSPEWEALCKRCGKCCHQCKRLKQRKDGTYYCIFYKKRYNIEDGCTYQLTLSTIFDQPEGCGYKELLGCVDE
jgi:uncharacterized cysteine cluster protein YcgN (CxxCxxCC family)